jgi:hypothetical protein
MPKNSSLSLQLAPEILDQDINPWSWVLTSLRQIGMINIIEMKSSDPGTEREIVENVAGYGRQLGRIVEALNVLLAHTETGQLKKEEKAALDDFSFMAEAIAAAKAGRPVKEEDRLERFLTDLKELEHGDPQRYRTIVDRLKGELKIGAAPEKEAGKTRKTARKTSTP